MPATPVSKAIKCLSYCKAPADPARAWVPGKLFDDFVPLTTPRFIAVGISTRALLETTGKARPNCTSIDFFVDRDTCQSVQKAVLIDDFTEAARHIESACDAIGQTGVLWAGGVENHIDLVSAIELNPMIKNLGCSSHSIRKARDPLAVANALEQAGIPALEVKYTPPSENISKWIAKPLRSGGGMNTGMMDNAGASFDPAHQYIQRFAPGPVFGATFIGTGNSANLIGCCRQLPSTNPYAPFRYESSVGPILMAESLTRQMHDIGSCVARQFSLCGWFGIDFAVDEDQVWLLEINPRFTASMELIDGRACRSLFELHMAAFADLPGERIQESIDTDIQFARKPVAAKQVLFNDADPDLLIDANKSDALWALNQKVESIVCDVPGPGWIAVPGSPICTIRSEGKCESEVIDRLAQIKKTVTSIVK